MENLGRGRQGGEVCEDQDGGSGAGSGEAGR